MSEKPAKQGEFRISGGQLSEKEVSQFVVESQLHKSQSRRQMRLIRHYCDPRNARTEVCAKGWEGLNSGKSKKAFRRRCHLSWVWKDEWECPRQGNAENGSPCRRDRKLPRPGGLEENGSAGQAWWGMAEGVGATNGIECLMCLAGE